jgi:hypothetical protein
VDLIHADKNGTPNQERIFFFCFEELSGGLEAFPGAWACFLETEKKNMSSFDQKKVFTVNFSTFVS